MDKSDKDHISNILLKLGRLLPTSSEEFMATLTTEEFKFYFKNRHEIHKLTDVLKSPEFTATSNGFDNFYKVLKVNKIFFLKEGTLFTDVWGEKYKPKKKQVTTTELPDFTSQYVEKIIAKKEIKENYVYFRTCSSLIPQTGKISKGDFQFIYDTTSKKYYLIVDKKNPLTENSIVLTKATLKEHYDGIKKIKNWPSKSSK